MIIFSFLQVDGSLLTNAGSAAGSFGGGGSGGSIFITTGVLTGGHTGVIQAKGGPVSTSYNGGGGAGGRIAAYYNNSIKDAFYGGVFETDGGSAGSSSESGASGTVYLKHTGQNNTKLIVDNNNGWAMETDITARGQKLELYTGFFSATSTSVSKNGITVSSSCRIYSVTHSYITTMYSLSALFDQTYKFSYYSTYNIRGSQVYIGDCHSGYIRVLLPKPVLVNSVRIYPVQGVSFKVRSLMLLMIINILYHIILYYIILYYIILHYITLYYIILYYIIFYYIILYHIIFYYITLYSITLYYIILHYIILHYIILHYIISYYIILYYIILYSILYIISLNMLPLFLHGVSVYEMVAILT